MTRNKIPSQEDHAAAATANPLFKQRKLITLVIVEATQLELQSRRDTVRKEVRATIYTCVYTSIITPPAAKPYQWENPRQPPWISDECSEIEHFITELCKSFSITPCAQGLVINVGDLRFFARRRRRGFSGAVIVSSLFCTRARRRRRRRQEDCMLIISCLPRVERCARCGADARLESMISPRSGPEIQPCSKSLAFRRRRRKQKTKAAAAAEAEQISL